MFGDFICRSETGLTAIKKRYWKKVERANSSYEASRDLGALRVLGG